MSAVPKELLNKEFLSQFKTEEDVSNFLKELHSQVLEQMLEGEIDYHLGYDKNSPKGNKSGNSRNGAFPKTIQTEHGKAVITVPRDRNGEFEPVVKKSTHHPNMQYTALLIPFHLSNKQKSI